MKLGVDCLLVNEVDEFGKDVDQRMREDLVNYLLKCFGLLALS